MKKIPILMMLFFPLSGLACKPVPIFKNSFNFKNYNVCQQQIKKCPRSGPFYLSACVTKTLAVHPECKQLSMLSHQSSVSADFIGAKVFNTLALITFNYPADGKQSYAVITSRGHMIPLCFNPKNKTLIATPAGSPIYKQNQSGEQQFSLTFKVLKGCLACKEVSRKTRVFKFNKQGHLSQK